MSELERTLRVAATQIAYPQTPDLMARLGEEPQPAGRPRATRRAPRPTRMLVLAAAGLLLVAATAIATLAGGDPKGVTIRVVDELPELPPSELPAPRALGERVSLGRADELAEFDVLAPPDPPQAVHYSDLAPGGIVTLVYPGALITQFQGSTDPELIGKLVTPDNKVERFRLDGDPAIWIEGAPHAVYLQDRNGAVIEETRRLAGNVLLLERDGLLVRIEGELSKERTVALARSLR